MQEGAESRERRAGRLTGRGARTGGVQELARIKKDQQRAKDKARAPPSLLLPLPMSLLYTHSLPPYCCPYPCPYCTLPPSLPTVAPTQVPPVHARSPTLKARRAWGGMVVAGAAAMERGVALVPPPVLTGRAWSLPP